MKNTIHAGTWFWLAGGRVFLGESKPTYPPCARRGASRNCFACGTNLSEGRGQRALQMVWCAQKAISQILKEMQSFAPDWIKGLRDLGPVVVNPHS